VESDTNTVSHIVRVKVLHSHETELCSPPEDEPIDDGDIVVLPTRYGKDLGVVLGAVRDADGGEGNSIQNIVRKATEADLETYRKNEEREKEALDICREKVEARGLDMKLVAAHYLNEESKVLFFFTADNRVDFRELVKDLVAVFKMRIELRQIGVRDESRVLGGVAVCGRTYCCHGVTDKLKPVSIKMAKEQNLSLNSMKISGPCGRLLCCLAYEYDFYRDVKRGIPSEGNRLRIDGQICKIIDVNVLSKIIKAVDGDGRYMSIPFCAIKGRGEKNEWYAETS
jgi:cell fate regulator YaaT (PSP1 superfamily)